LPSAGAHQLGAHAVVVDAIDHNTSAFYAHHGFLALGPRRRYGRVADIEPISSAYCEADRAVCSEQTVARKGAERR
jgi:hypothetical protein